MKKAFSLLALLALVAGLTSISFAAGTTFVITNDDNPAGNSATVYKLNTTTGVLTQAKVLKTGGTGLGFGFFASKQSTVTQGLTCVFVEDAGSNDIATFSKATHFSKVGNFSNSALSFSGFAGGSLALNAAGTFLYASYSGSENIGVWAVGSDCSLTLVGSPFVPKLGPDLFGAIAISPNGKFLVIGSDSFEAADLAAINSTTGALTDMGSVSFTSVNGCSGGCFPAGIDFTKDSRVVIMGNATTTAPSALTASLSATGLKNPKEWSLTNTAGTMNDNVPWLNAAAFAGNGNLYFGMAGFGVGIPSGVVTTAFVESPLSITVTNSTLINNTEEFQDSIASAGSLMITAEPPNVLDTFTINADGSLTLLQSTTDAQANGEINFDIFPKTR